MGLTPQQVEMDGRIRAMKEGNNEQAEMAAMDYESSLKQIASTRVHLRTWVKHDKQMKIYPLCFEALKCNTASLREKVVGAASRLAAARQIALPALAANSDTPAARQKYTTMEEYTKELNQSLKENDQRVKKIEEEWRRNGIDYKPGVGTTITDPQSAKKYLDSSLMKNPGSSEEFASRALANLQLGDNAAACADAKAALRLYPAHSGAKDTARQTCPSGGSELLQSLNGSVWTKTPPDSGVITRLEIHGNVLRQYAVYPDRRKILFSQAAVTGLHIVFDWENNWAENGGGYLNGEIAKDGKTLILQYHCKPGPYCPGASQENFTRIQ